MGHGQRHDHAPDRAGEGANDPVDRGLQGAAQARLHDDHGGQHRPIALGQAEEDIGDEIGGHAGDQDAQTQPELGRVRRQPSGHRGPSLAHVSSRSTSFNLHSNRAWAIRSRAPQNGQRMEKLVVTDLPDAADREAIVTGLIRFNQEATGAAPSRSLAVLLKQADGTTAGGLLGRTWGGWLYVELLYVPDAARGTGLGRALMARAEAEARARGCRGIWLDTFSFQARGFYEKLGFTVIGRLDDYPPGHQRFFLQKRL